MAELFRPGASAAWDYTWQATVFLLAGGLAGLLAARRPSRAHRLLLLSMIAALVTPPLCQAVRRLGWGLWAEGSAAVRSEAEVPASPSATPAPIPASFRPMPGRDRLPIVGVDPPRIPSTPVTRPVVHASATPAPTPRRLTVSWPTLAIGVWAVLGVLATVRLGGSMLVGRRVLAGSRPLEDAALEAASEEARGRLGLAVRPEVRASDRVRCPVVWCWGRRPILLVPSGMPDGSDAVDWAAVFCHELAHWKRRDNWSGLVAEVLACVLPWHPLAWWARSRLAALSELACDDWVLASGRPAADYAESLLGLLPQRRPALLPAAVSSRGGLVRRVRHILDGHRPAPAAGRAWTALAVAAMALIATATALAQARPAKDDQSEKPMPMPKTKDEAAQTPAHRRSLRGTVLGPDGRPAAGVSLRWVIGRKVGLSFVARPKEEVVDEDEAVVTLAEGRTDDEGRFVFDAAYDTEAYFQRSTLVIWGPGFGARSRTVGIDDRDLTIRLSPMVLIRGRILTPSGMPAAGVKVALSSIQDLRDEIETLGGDRNKGEDHPEYWPRPRTTDSDGRFTIEGVPAGVFASLELTHPDYAVDEVTVTTGPKTAPGIEAFEIVPVPAEFEHALEPARPVEGTVTAADTGKPLANLRVEMTPMRSHGGQSFHTRTDAQGHYRVSGHQADMYITTVCPPADSGYLSVAKTQQGWPAGAKSLVVNFALKRGKILRGRVIDADTGRPVPGCGLVYQPRRGNPNNRNEYDLRSPTRTDEKGEFRITALPGEGVVAVEAPDPDYIRVMLTKTVYGTAYPHGFAEVKLPEEGEAAPVEVRLRKGVTLEARAVDPEGRTVKGVVAYHKGIDAVLIDKWDQGQHFEDGLFHLKGADPSQTYRVFFIHPKRRLATVAELKYDPKARAPIEVRLTPTASVRGRLLDTAGNPVKSAQVYPSIVVAQQEGELSRDEVFDEDKALIYANFVNENRDELGAQEKPNDRGEFLLEALVPGVRFYITAWSGGREAQKFVPPLRPGEVRDLGNIILKERER